MSTLQKKMRVCFFTALKHGRLQQVEFFARVGVLYFLKSKFVRSFCKVGPKLLLADRFLLQRVGGMAFQSREEHR